MNFQILESKLNTHSIEELEMQDPNTFGVIINKLLHLSLNPNKSQESAINVLAYSIANLETKGRTKHTNRKNIYFDRRANNWSCSLTVDGKYKKIKTNKDRLVVEEALRDYCKQNNITLQ